MSVPPLWLVAALAHADAQSAFDAGLAHERRGESAEAVASFRQALDEGGVHPAVYHGLGNALLRQDRLGPALAAYARGLRLDPGQADMAANAALARQRTQDHLEPPAPDVGPFFWQRQWSSRSTLLWASGLWTLALGVGVLERWRRRPTAALRGVALVSAVVGTLLGASTAWVARGAGSAVVVAPRVVARSTFGPDGIELFELHEGAELRVVERDAEAWLVALPDDRRGWVPTSALWDCDPAAPFPDPATLLPAPPSTPAPSPNPAPPSDPPG